MTWTKSCVIFAKYSLDNSAPGRIPSSMPPIEDDPLHCEECGASLQSGTSKLGCLNCLLLGGPNEPGPESRRFQDYEICCREDGVTLDELGRGAMGITYRAQDLTLGSPSH